MSRTSKRHWPWHLLTLAILAVIALIFWYATVSTAYKWDWNNISNYFYYNKEVILETAPSDVGVASLDQQGQKTIITLVDYATDEEFKITANADEVKVFKGQELVEGDTISSTTQWTAGPFVQGFWTTLWLSVVSGILGLVIGLIAGLCRISKNPTLRDLSTVYVELIRALPLLVIIFIIYYFFGTILKLSHETAAIISLSFSAGAYIAEIVRGGIQSISKGQTEAARSLGMGAASTMCVIILPQAFRRILPALTGQFINLVKDTSLLSAISIIEITRAAQLATTTSMKPFEMWFCAAALYLLINIPLSVLAHYLERRLAKSD
ncbi:amino acid ABC transporter permease [Entomomonas sp. E2T0]|uniref:amino acid ABC transporter permease n=1 Tax=Entomomonas sp. E2T0 TaxID=2930213 RepID=UPI0022281AEE|nr:amino acid ABC transporter permease [Entomomonas sp. E2T0]UYZ84624.1 amino acid ABC transporter permease [Entomomonas sp. E2T0]